MTPATCGILDRLVREEWTDTPSASRRALTAVCRRRTLSAMSRHKITVRIDKEDRTLIHDLAMTAGTTPSTITRMAIRSGLPKVHAAVGTLKSLREKEVLDIIVDDQ